MTTSAWNDRSDIQIEERDVELVSEFCYLDSYISFNGSCEKDVKVRIGKAATVFGKTKKIWRHNNVRPRDSYFWNILYTEIDCRLLLTGA